MKWMGYAIYCAYVLSTLWLLISALVQLHLHWHARRGKNNLRKPIKGLLPFVSIQVPVYNEKYVIEGLLLSLASLDYPKELYEIQVLDDSTDETSNLIDRQAYNLKEQGIQVNVVRRPGRQDYKAGALQYGLPLCKGELIAIFDADFRPPAHFLLSLVPHFSHSSVGLVQARWGHLNREQNFLTRIQTYLLDLHFMVEQAGRYNAGFFSNFCGTAGIWRKQCILDSGGWDGKVLSEDLDLSYRAQLKGWTIVYDKDVEVPAQVPAVVEAFKIQQFRWTKGIAQTARKTLRQVWHMPGSVARKLHSTFHLMGSFTFVCLFISAILTIPLLTLRNVYPEFIRLTNYTTIGALNLVVLAYLYYRSSTAATLNLARFIVNYPVFLVVYMAMSIQNTIAVVQGFGGSRSAFVRTPKFASDGEPHNSYIIQRMDWKLLLEIGFLLYFCYGIGLSFYFGDYFMLGFFLLISSGLAILIYHSGLAEIVKKWFLLRMPLLKRAHQVS